MKSPTVPELLFSFKSFFAALLALYIAMSIGLPRPFRAMLTAYAQELDRNAALSQTRTLYRYGRIEFPTTLDAGRTPASSERALAASDAQPATNRIALFLALGGGWEGEDGASAQ